MLDLVWLVVAAALACVSLWWQRRAGLLSVKPEPHNTQGIDWAMVPLGLAFAVFAGGAMAALVAQGASGQTDPATASLTQSAQTSLLTYGLAVPVALGAWWFFSQSAMGVRPERHMTPWSALRAGVVALALWLPVIISAGMLGRAVQVHILGQSPPLLSHNSLRQIIDGDAPLVWRAGLIGAVVVGAPIVEELLYRGLLQTALCRALRSTWGGVVCASAVFTLAHAAAIPGEAWLSASMTLLVLSTALGLVFARTRSILAPIAVHVGFNAVNVLGAFVLT